MEVSTSAFQKKSEQWINCVGFAIRQGGADKAKSQIILFCWKGQHSWKLSETSPVRQDEQKSGDQSLSPAPSIQNTLITPQLSEEPVFVHSVLFILPFLHFLMFFKRVFLKKNVWRHRAHLHNLHTNLRVFPNIGFMWNLILSVLGIVANKWSIN